MQRRVGAARLPEIREPEIGDHLVGVHVGGGAGAALDGIDHEGVVVLARDDGGASGLDGRSLGGGQEAQPRVGPRGCLLDERQGTDEVGKVADRNTRDGEVLDRAHRVDAPERVGRDVGLAEKVMLPASPPRLQADLFAPRRKHRIGFDRPFRLRCRLGRRGGLTWH